MSKMLGQMGLVSAMTMLSRVFGLFRDVMITAIFGTSLLNSAFTAAFALPSLFRRLLGEGALAAALMPNLSEEMEFNGKEAVFKLLNKTLSWLLLICVALALVAYGIFDWLESVSTEDNRVIGARLAKLVFPYIIPVCLAAIVSAVLNMLGRFGIPAMTAIWLNFSMMLFLGAGGWWLAESQDEKMLFLCLGVLVGGLLQLIVPGIALAREGWKPSFDFSVSSRLRSVLLLTLPGIFGVASYQLNVVVSRLLALDFNDSGATLIYLANRLVELPLGIFTMAIATVVFPVMSRSIARGDESNYGEMYLKGISLSMMLTIPAALGIMILAPEIITTLFQRGAFEESDTQALVPILMICAAGMPFYGFVSIETRALYAIKDAKTPVRGSAIALVVNIVLSIALLKFLNRIEGLVIASNTAIVAQAAYLHRILARQSLGIRLKAIASAIVKYIVIGLFMLLVLVAVKTGLSRVGSFGENSLITLLISVVVGTSLYLTILKCLRMEEVNEVFDALLKRGQGRKSEE